MGHWRYCQWFFYLLVLFSWIIMVCVWVMFVKTIFVLVIIICIFFLFDLVSASFFFLNYLLISPHIYYFLSFSYSLGSFSISTLYFFTFCSVDLFGLAIEFSSYFFSKQLDRMNLENQLHILQERTNKEGVNSIVQKLVLLMMPL